MNQKDLENLKIPAFQRKKMLTRKAGKRLAWTALDRQKEALSSEQRKVNKYVSPAPRVVSSSQKSNFFTKKNARVSIGDLMETQDFSDPLDFAAPVSQPKISRSKIVASEPVKASSRYEAIGEVTHFLEKIQVAIVKLSRQLRISDFVAFEEENGLFFQEVASMQINRKDVKTAKKGAEIGMKVIRPPKVGGKMYLSKI